MTVEYTVIEKVPSAEAFCHLRVAAGMSPRPLEGARAGLPRSCYGVHILWQETPIAMGRIVGDGAINFDIVDVAVDPAHQGKGLGRLVMEKLIAWLDDRMGIEVVGMAQGPARSGHLLSDDWSAVEAFAQREGFPQHQLVLRPESQEDRKSVV